MIRTARTTKGTTMRTLIKTIPSACLLAAATATFAASPTIESIKSVSKPNEKTTTITEEEDSVRVFPFQISSGIILLNPYVVTNFTDTSGRTRGNLEKGDGTKARFFIEVSYNQTWVSTPNKRYDFLYATPAANPNTRHLQKWFWDQDDPSVDIQARLNYIAKDDKETTTAAIIGSGEFSGEITLGLPVWRKINLNDTVSSLQWDDEVDIYKKTADAHWVGLVASYSAVTDSGAFDIHDRIFGGVGYRAMHKAGFVADGREFSISLNGGVAFVDSLEFISKRNHEVRLVHGDVPDYEMKAVGALEAEVNLPLTGNISATLGTRFYTGLDPNVWTAYVAVTVDDISKFVKRGSK